MEIIADNLRKRAKSTSTAALAMTSLAMPREAVALVQCLKFSQEK
jgi:hypothetical protein